MNQTARRDYFWNTLGVLLQNATSPIMLLIVTRVNGIEMSGAFSFAFSLSLLLWAFGMWGGRTYQVSDTQSEFEHRSYVLVRVILAIGMFALAGVFCWLNDYDGFKTSLIFGLVAFKVLESFADVLYGILQVNKQLYISGISLTVKAIAGVVLFGLIDAYTHNILLAVASVIVINLIVLVSYDFVHSNKLEKITFPPAELKKYLQESRNIMKRCAAVFIVFFLAMFSLNIPRYFIDLHDEKDVGIFGIIAMPITLIVLLISFILQPNIVELAKLYNKRNFRRFETIVNKILTASAVTGVLVLVATMAVGPQILKFIFGIDFRDNADSLNVIVAGGIACALVTVYLNVFIIMRKVTIPFWVLLATNVVLIGAAYIAVDAWRLIGGVWAFTATNIIQLVILYLYFNANARGNHE